jgi:hypothetical protein
MTFFLLRNTSLPIQLICHIGGLSARVSLLE